MPIMGNMSQSALQTSVVSRAETPYIPSGSSFPTSLPHKTSEFNPINTNKREWTSQKRFDVRRQEHLFATALCIENDGNGASTGARLIARNKKRKGSDGGSVVTLETLCESFVNQWLNEQASIVSGSATLFVAPRYTPETVSTVGDSSHVPPPDSAEHISKSVQPTDKAGVTNRIPRIPPVPSVVSTSCDVSGNGGQPEGTEIASECSHQPAHPVRTSSVFTQTAFIINPRELVSKDYSVTFSQQVASLLPQSVFATELYRLWSRKGNNTDSSEVTLDEVNNRLDNPEQGKQQEMEVEETKTSDQAMQMVLRLNGKFQNLCGTLEAHKQREIERQQGEAEQLEEIRARRAAPGLTHDAELVAKLSRRVHLLNDRIRHTEHVQTAASSSADGQQIAQHYLEARN